MRLRGTGAEERAAAPVDAPASHVVLLREEQWLDLWPLVDYGRAQANTMQCEREADEPSPQVYFRSERDRLLYTALAGNLPIAERRDALASFRALFQLDGRAEAGGEEDDFEKEIDADSDSLVGRESEIKQAKQAIKAAPGGVLWIGGPGGMGKSFLMARLARDLRGDGRKSLRIAWRFRVSDQRRSNRAAFLRHVHARLGAWLADCGVLKGAEQPEADPRRLEDQVNSLLAIASAAKARVLILLDGMDEVARPDPAFPQLPFEWSRDHIVWVCAGRPEGGVEATFSKDRCRHVFEDGLPPMKADDIRAMLLGELGWRKYDV